MRLRSVRRRKGRRGRKRRKRVLEQSASAIARGSIGVSTGRLSLQRLALPRTEDWPRAVSLVCLAGLMWLMLHFFTSQRFFIYDVQVSGNQFVSNEEIYDQSGLHTLSIFYVRPSEVSQRLLSLANIKEAEVRTRLPGVVTIAVTERLPQVELESGGVRYWVDSEGVVLPARGELDQTIVVVSEDETALKPGDHFDVEALHTAQQLHELLPQVSRLVYSETRGISVPTDEGWPVVFGTSEDLPAKVAIYRSLVKKFSKEGTAVALVDLRFLRRPYYRVRDQ